MSDLKTQIQTLEKKAEAYDNLKAVQSNKIRIIRDLLSKAIDKLNDLNGDSQIKTPTKEIISQVYRMLVEGQVNKVYTEVIETKFQIEKTRAQSIKYVVQKMSGIDVGKDENGKFLFFDKTRVQ